MKLILHNTIKDTFTEINSPVENYLLTLFERSDFQDYPPVSFNVENSTIIDVKDGDLEEYLKLNNIDVDNPLLISTILCDGFLTMMKSYNKVVEDEILVK